MAAAYLVCNQTLKGAAGAAGSRAGAAGRQAMGKPVVGEITSRTAGMLESVRAHQAELDQVKRFGRLFVDSGFWILYVARELMTANLARPEIKSNRLAGFF